MDTYNYEQLLTLIGDRVQVSDEQGNSVELTISEVIQGRQHGHEWEAFSVIYTSEEAMDISQGTYSFDHQGFDNQKLFLSPNSNTEFETVISRARDEQKASPAEQPA
ncbi:DUF6916 family protein [Cognaticolwellia mytili]|uniref:DUF6916 family protein n=1 Tax=Cognaticolwellia mytili TaxID=1888913 RepID=UPI000A171670|nr:hypothetical protein [Cognaticolwellia mytili]